MSKQPIRGYRNEFIAAELYDYEDNYTQHSYSDSASDYEEENLKSIQLIDASDKKRIKINKQALDYLKSINEEFGLIVCMGPYRQGKSYLLNRITEQKNAFQVGHTDKACTKGIWMLKSPIRIKTSQNKEIKCMVFDTEGLESDESDEEWDNKLFLTSFLMSSLLIYNSKNTLTADSFKKLSVISNLAKRIRSEASDSKDAPNFIWVVRDYSLQSTMTPNDRLQKFLQNETFKYDDDLDKSSNDQKKEKVNIRNKIRQSMVRSFNKMECHYLPIPVADDANGKSLEEALISMNHMDPKHLRPKFNRDFDALKMKISQLTNVKSIENKKLNGPLFAQFLEKIVKLIDSDSQISLSDTLSSIISAQAEEILKSAKQKYTKEMQELMRKYEYVKPMSKADFEREETKIANDSIGLMRSNNLLQDMMIDYVKKFEDFRKTTDSSGKLVGGKKFEYFNLNADRIKSFNEKMAQQKWDNTFKSKLTNTASFTSKSQFDSQVSSMKEEIRKEAFDLDNYEAFWSQFKDKVNLSQYERNVDYNILNIEKQKNIQLQSALSSNPLNFDHNPFNTNDRGCYNGASNFGGESCCSNNPDLSDLIYDNYKSRSANTSTPTNISTSSNENYKNVGLTPTGYVLQQGPRGGLSYVNDQGNRNWVNKEKYQPHVMTPPRSLNSSTSSYSSMSSSSGFRNTGNTTASGYNLQVGPRGGISYVNDSGRRVYTKR